MKPKVDIFDGKKKNAISTSGFLDNIYISRPFIFWLSCCGSISEASIQGNLKEFICFKVATYVE